MLAILLSAKDDVVDRVLSCKQNVIPIKVRPIAENSFKVYLCRRCKVVCEFICNNVAESRLYEISVVGWKNSKFKTKDGNILDDCLSDTERNELINSIYDKTIYGLQIDDLKVYDVPKELSIFKKKFCEFEKLNYFECDRCKYHRQPEFGPPTCEYDYSIKQKPSTYCYVRDVDNE